MNRLTDRLQLIADHINKGETVADIGTDHGFLPLYLYEEGISPKVIMCDISEPSLAKARDAFAKRFGEEGDCEMFAGEGYESRAGDGLKVIDYGEVHTVVIAGMGGLLIRDILAADIEKSKSMRKFILQPRNNSGLLRYWLVKNGFRITHNLLVREGNFICEIIVSVPAAEVDMAIFGVADAVVGPDHVELSFPHEFVERYPQLGMEYAEVKLGIEEKIKDGIMKSCNNSESDILAVEKRIDYYKRILNL